METSVVLAEELWESNNHVTYNRGDKFAFFIFSLTFPEPQPIPQYFDSDFSEIRLGLENILFA